MLERNAFLQNERNRSPFDFKSNFSNFRTTKKIFFLRNGFNPNLKMCSKEITEDGKSLSHSRIKLKLIQSDEMISGIHIQIKCELIQTDEMVLRIF